MKVKPSINGQLCKGCYITRKGGVLVVRCKKNPKHKQRQGN